MFALRKQALHAISQGITSLYHQQKKDGSFLSFSSPHPHDFVNALQFHSTFSTSIILDSLSTHPPTKQLDAIKRKAASFLLKQKSEYWSFNYWARDSKEAKKLPYPDDLDDTACALSALFHYDTKVIDGSVLAYVVQMLTATEVKEGGPYRTWLVEKKSAKSWKDIDVAVNSNVAYFLSLQGITLPKLTDYIEYSIINKSLTSPYYPTIYPIIYFISRFYKGKYKNDLVKLLLAKRDKHYSWGNPLNNALAISSLINFQGQPDSLDDSIFSLLQTQEKGAWKPYAFYTGVNPKKNGMYFAGSEAITTAFCLEALNKYTHSDNIKTEKKHTIFPMKATQLHTSIVQQVEERLSFLDETSRNNANLVIEKIMKNDSQKQVTLLSYYFADALGVPKDTISDDFIIELGVANLSGWIAYTIYDDFLDEEGDPRLLSIANSSLRTVSEIYESILPQKTAFRKAFHTIMDTIDRANAWEALNCRITVGKSRVPDFHNFDILAEKSLGHALGPVALLFSLGYTWNSPEVKNFMLFFKHYLIARQLNDDAHDWEQDLLKGYCNSVGSLLLKKTSSDGNEKVTTENYIQKLQKIFWYETVLEVCSEIQRHSKFAREALHRCSTITNFDLFDQLLIPYEKAAESTLSGRKNALAFLHTYTSTVI